jgi:glycosyltransferase involved in cell wall biosynthesis
VTRVLLDGRPLFDGHSRHRGIGVFVRSLLEGLVRVPGLSVATLVTPGTEVPPGVRAVPVHRTDHQRIERFEHALRLSFEIPRSRPDVFHSPALEPPLRCGRPWVQTLHDVTPLVYDDPFFGEERKRWQRVFGRMRGADAIVADSRYSADLAVRVLGFDPSRVHVVPIGVEDAFRTTGERGEPDPPYLLYVGVYGPHKGYAEALRTIDLVAERGHPHRLKIVGTLNSWREKQIAGLLARASHPERVDLLGFVEQNELVRLYREASALIVTSRCEGFGLPAAEAMAAGTPVAAFDNTAIGEVVRDGGALIRDGDVDAMAEEVSALLEDLPRARASIERGLIRARSFDWAESARRYAEIYRSVAGTPGR